MKIRSLFALAATTAALALSPVSHADDISGAPDPTTGLGAPIAKNVRFVRAVFTEPGIHPITASSSLATATSPEEGYIYLGDSKGQVYQCHNFPATTSLLSLTCNVYTGKK